MGGGSVRTDSVPVGLAAVAFIALMATMPVAAQGGFLHLTFPDEGSTFRPGDLIVVMGRAVESDGTPLGSLRIDLRLETAAGMTIPRTEVSSHTSPDGTFTIGVRVPADLANGPYFLTLVPADTAVQGARVAILVRAPPPVPTLTYDTTASAGIVLAVAAGAAVLVAYAVRRSKPSRGFP